MSLFLLCCFSSVTADAMTGDKKSAQAIEQQAIGRAHRQGQTNQVTIVRFVVRNTIEHETYLRNYSGDVNSGKGEEGAPASTTTTTQPASEAVAATADTTTTTATATDTTEAEQQSKQETTGKAFLGISAVVIQHITHCFFLVTDSLSSPSRTHLHLSRSHSLTSRPRLLRASSVTTLLANADTSDCTAASVIKLMESSEDVQRPTELPPSSPTADSTTNNNVNTGNAGKEGDERDNSNNNII